MVVVIDVEPIRERFLTVAPFLDERGRRLVAAAEAFAAGYGGIAAVAMATGMDSGTHAVSSCTGVNVTVIPKDGAAATIAATLLEIRATFATGLRSRAMDPRPDVDRERSAPS